MSCQGVVKFLLFFVNTIFSLLGIGIFVGGVLGIIYVNKINESNTNEVAGEIPTFVGPLFMTIGAVVFFVSFCGCFGAIKEINCLLVLYSIIMFLLMAIKVAISVYLLVIKAPAVGELNKIMNDFPRTNKTIPIEFHVFEYMEKCCGVNGPDSYISIGAPIPVYCCPIQQLGNPEVCSITSKYIYREGCKDILDSHEIERSIDIISFSLIGIALFELASMISAMYLVCYTRKSGGYYEYD